MSNESADNQYGTELRCGVGMRIWNLLEYLVPG
jgi:hypothetical protein